MSLNKKLENDKKTKLTIKLIFTIDLKDKKSNERRL